MARASKRHGGTHRGVFFAGVAVGLGAAGLVWIGGALWSRALAPAQPGVRVVSTFAPGTAAGGVTREDETPPATRPTPSAEADPAPVTPHVGARREIELPVYQKLISSPLSHEPHQVLGAWDEDAEGATPGQRRAFVLAVAPSQSDGSLEALARDLRAQNLDALILDVRIYDDPTAALGPRVVDGGQRARAHVVAEVQRNQGAGLDVIRVRGHSLDPR